MGFLSAKVHVQSLTPLTQTPTAVTQAMTGDVSGSNNENDSVPREGGTVGGFVEVGLLLFKWPTLSALCSGITSQALMTG